MHFPAIWTQIWNYLQPWLDKLVWEKIQQINWREMKPQGVYRNMKGCSLKLSWRTRLLVNTVYHFVGPHLVVEMFSKKEGSTEKGWIDFKIGDWGTSSHLHWSLKKTSCRACLVLYCFIDDKKRISFKSSIDLYFHILIIDLYLKFFWFA